MKTMIASATRQILVVQDVRRCDFQHQFRGDLIEWK